LLPRFLYEPAAPDRAAKAAHFKLVLVAVGADHAGVKRTHAKIVPTKRLA
jgi:hypothetical protein